MDPSWCPGCDRLILPKRVVVPVDPTPAPFEHDSSDSEHHPPPPPAPTPVPSSPEVRRKPVDQQAPRAQRRLGGGLVHGTGRVRPGGGLRKEKKQQPPQQVVVEPQQPAPAPAPKKTRVLISQEPTPLYCSEECRIRDLKNSFIQSEGAGFAAAPAAFNRVNQLELVQETIRRLKSCRPTYAASQRSPQSTPSTSPETPTHDQSYPLVPPNSLTEAPKHPIFRTDSMSSCGSYASNGTTEHDTDSTIRIPRTKKTHPPRVPSWGSPSKSSLAPTVRTLYNASSSSLDTMAISATLSSGASPLFEGGPVLCTAVAEAEDTASTTPSRSSEGSNGKKKKRVSFASDSKPAPPRLPRMSRPKNPLLEANPVRAALSLSPKDRLVRPSSLPTTTAKPAPSQHHSKSTPDLARLQQQYSSLRSATETPPKNPYGVAMWPEDEKRSTPCTQVHGDLLRGYAKKFAPREGRSLVYSNIWTGLEREEKENSDDGLIEEVEEEERGHDERDDGEREYWRRYEERERERRAKRKAEEEVRKLEEARVIREMLGGVGCNEEDQPQARKMGKIAYDGMPGPAENRGLKYDFNHFLYDLIPPKPKIVERTVKRWDPTRKAFVEEICREEVFPERKKLFNFDD